MRDKTESQIIRAGVVFVVIAILAMAAALNLQKFPGFRGVTYYAEFTDASGLRPGHMVQVAGIRVGRVADIELKGDHVVARFTIEPDVRFGSESTASVEVLNLLGEKFLDLQPAGDGATEAGTTIPRERTTASYDIVEVFDQLSDTTERIKIPQLQKALDVVADTMNRTNDEARGAFDGLSRLSETIASRDDELQSLLENAASVANLLDRRKGDVVSLVRQGDLILGELRRREQAINQLLVNTGVLSQQLGGLVDDNQAQLKPMLQELQQVTKILVDRQDSLEQAVINLEPYINILSNIVGNGPWFDAFAVNLFGPFTGEFLPGQG